MLKRATAKTDAKAGHSKMTSIPPDVHISVEGEGSSSSHHDIGTHIQDERIRVPDTDELITMMQDPHQVAQMMAEMKK